MKIGWIRYPEKLYKSGRVTKGGSETANQYVINFLRSKGCEVIDFMPETNERINLIDLPALGTPLMFQDLVKRIVEMNGCDIVVTTNWFGAILPELKVPLVTVFHSNSSMVMESIKDKNITDKETLDKWLNIVKKYSLAKPSIQQDHEKVISFGEKYFATKSDLIISVSDLLKQSLTEFYGSEAGKIQVIFNSFDNQWLEVNVGKSFDGELNLINVTRLPDDFNGFVGKGADRTFEVFSKVDLDKVLVASGKPVAYRSFIDENLNRVKLVESADRQTVASELANAHISIHCSRCEACQLTLIEAMLMKTVPISFKVGVASEFIEHGKNGFLVDSVDEMLEYVKVLREDRKKMAEMASLARETILQKCSINEIGQKYLEVFGHIISGGKNA